MKAGSVASKFISLFTCSFIFALFYIAFYEEGFYISLFPAVYFMVFSFSFFVSFPLSILVDRASIRTDKLRLKLIFRLVIGLLGMGAAAVLALLIGWNVSMELVSYGLLALFLFSILDYIFTALEQKSKDSERLQMDKI